MNIYIVKYIAIVNGGYQDHSDIFYDETEYNKNRKSAIELAAFGYIKDLKFYNGFIPQVN